jgi:hypothetical protein
MTLLKAIVCLALIFAAVVLFPLRRAQQAFAPRGAGATVASAPRPKFRRRPGRALAAIRRHHAVVASEFATAVKVKAPRRRRTASTVSHVRSAQLSRHAMKPSSPGHAPAAHAADSGATHFDFAPPGRAVRPPEPECARTPVANPPLSVTPQAVGDIPVPPPKATL